MSASHSLLDTKGKIGSNQFFNMNGVPHKFNLELVNEVTKASAIIDVKKVLSFNISHSIDIPLVTAVFTIEEPTTRGELSAFVAGAQTFARLDYGPVISNPKNPELMNEKYKIYKEVFVVSDIRLVDAGSTRDIFEVECVSGTWGKMAEHIRYTSMDKPKKPDIILNELAKAAGITLKPLTTGCGTANAITYISSHYSSLYDSIIYLQQSMANTKTGFYYFNYNPKEHHYETLSQKEIFESLMSGSPKKPMYFVNTFYVNKGETSDLADTNFSGMSVLSFKSLENNVARAQREGLKPIVTTKFNLKTRAYDSKTVKTEDIIKASADRSEKYKIFKPNSSKTIADYSTQQGFNTYEFNDLTNNLTFKLHDSLKGLFESVHTVQIEAYSYHNRWAGQLGRIISNIDLMNGQTLKLNDTWSKYTGAYLIRSIVKTIKPNEGVAVDTITMSKPDSYAGTR